MIKHEAAFQTQFGKWVKYNWQKSALFELKHSKTETLPFAAVKAHQIQNLLNAKHRKVFWKISDFSPEQKPADCFLIARAQGYLVISFTGKEDKNDTFIMIDIDNFVKEMGKSRRKSLTRARAREIGREYRLGVVYGSVV